MVSEYVLLAPPTNLGMKMVTGRRLVDIFGGGWRFKPLTDGSGTVAIWRDSSRCRPALIRPIAHRLGRRRLDHEISRRMTDLAAGCADPVVLEAATAAVRGAARSAESR